MTLHDYLDRQARRLSRSRARVCDFKVFDFNHLPAEPVMRAEAKPIVDACVRFLHTGIANHLFIFGGRGCGKTLMVRHIGNLLAADVIYANCRHHNSSFKLLAHWLGARPRGHSMDELWERFCRQHDGPTIIVLDEIDLISDKDRNREILYLISRAERPYMAILLSNNPRFMNTVDQSIRSTLQPELIHFVNYNADQVLGILKDRAEAGIAKHARPTTAELARLAALTVQHTQSDVRIAIKALYYLAVEGTMSDDALRDEGRVDTATAEGVFERARRDLVADVLRNLHDRDMLILAAAITVKDAFVKEIYRRYRQMSAGYGEEPFSYPYFLSSLYYLQSIGLIGLMSTKVGRTYTNRVQLLFDPDLAQGVWSARLG
jgi:Cdc6-like AAA superfamily ATPase